VPPGGPIAGGAGGRVVFTGEGGDLFKIYLINYIAPFLGGYLVIGVMMGIATFVEQQAKTGGIMAGLAKLLAVNMLMTLITGGI